MMDPFFFLVHFVVGWYLLARKKNQKTKWIANENMGLGFTHTQSSLWFFVYFSVLLQQVISFFSRYHKRQATCLFIVVKLYWWSSLLIDYIDICGILIYRRNKVNRLSTELFIVKKKNLILIPINTLHFFCCITFLLMMIMMINEQLLYIWKKIDNG